MEHFDDVDSYLAASELWPDEIARLRPVLLGTGLEETIKWGKPCYLDEGRNICIVQEMKDFLALMFFKGALLADPEGVLESQGDNTRSARRMTFRSPEDVDRLADTIGAYVDEAVAVEDAGLEVEPAPEPELVAELAARLEADAELRAAFEALTPGRRRAHNLHIGEAKKADTREARIDRVIPHILAGKGPQGR